MVEIIWKDQTREDKIEKNEIKCEKMRWKNMMHNEMNWSEMRLDEMRWYTWNSEIFCIVYNSVLNVLIDEYGILNIEIC